MADITTGSRNHQDSVTDGKYPFFVRSDKVERLNEYDFDTRAILVPGDGRIGEIFHYYNGKFALHQRVYKVDNFNGINELFLLGQFKYSFKKHALRLNAQGTVPSLRLPMFTNWNISIPNITEQERIGSFFRKLDQTITLHEEKKHQLERLKSALLQKMFADKSGYPVVRFKKYNSTWVLRRIIDLLNQAITDGPHETPCLVSKGIPFISADAIVNNKIDFSRKRGNITEEYDLECCKKYQPQMHDIYLVKSGSTVGKVAIVETTTRFNIWSPLAALRCGEKSDPYFVFFLMQTEKFQTQVKNKASNGTQPNLSMRALEGFKVIVSTELNEQQAIGNLFKKMNELIDLHQHKIDNLIAVKQWLLQNMFI